MPHMPAGLRRVMYVACSALFRHIVKDVTVLLPIPHQQLEKLLTVGCSNQNVDISVQSLQEGVLEYEAFATDKRMLRAYALT